MNRLLPAFLILMAISGCNTVIAEANSSTSSPEATEIATAYPTATAPPTGGSNQHQLHIVDPRDPNSETFDICAVEPTPTPDPNATAIPPTETPIEIIYPGDRAALAAATFSPDDIGSRDETGSYRILIIPVGYPPGTDLNAEFEPIIRDLEAIWTAYGLNVRYAYLRHTLPLTVYFPGSFVTDYQQVNDIRAKLSDSGTYTYHVTSMFIYNPDKGRSSMNGDQQSIWANTRRYLYSAVHEGGHQLSLSDGYQAHYSPENIHAGVSSELFIDYTTLSPQRQDALFEHEEALLVTRFTCYGQEVYTPLKNSLSIMQRNYSNTEMIHDGQVNPYLFSPYQVSIMQNYLKDKLATSP